ncbi:hypothetical protein pEaSNUABM40_00230 [Erwinia phage pEa_SNUABM_40]|uniref:Uncharacterized protein n=1 Tax=Erwinia phage pEa_SNUABM_3 TaxID=2869552 RepID=A0AAE8BYM2_9CAUD|nr:hypothetical protein MPK68_gp227 [Erwinia phage pEa_SNUABM_3]QZE56762.1 hypothetical protein pEaSNUABM20_00226 [Erwinia phage pEa_SNUABM_20]QZE58446.1 hypothetical protein pEaSNUABM40_00230 [Erwinia phage pEa_SNUABM_40]UAW53007.1 hypothetical protein pEaSNUABM23_00225 [Erwinia phage pEa_SNUABM_23]UIW10903.1 hypothetical protein pEaSNUABM23_00225 [Erwinia phage pEa_SNUABM_31]QZE56424.1 hypothetical protein pEaSNUABM3_00227 [Erwinia phage pEa_SNUABM_3]
MSTKNNTQVQPITLTKYNELYGDNPVAPMYVANRTEPRGNVMFSAKDDLGQPVAVLVPATFIPIDLTQQATKTSLMQSTHLRRALRIGQLVILETETAEEYLRTSAMAKTEMRHLNKMNASIAAELEEVDGQLAPINLAGGNTKKQIQFEDGDQLSSNQFVNAFIARAAEDSGESDDNLEREFLSRGLGLPVSELEILRANISRPAIVDLIVQAITDA